MIAKENLELGIFVLNLQGEIFQISRVSDSGETICGIDVDGEEKELSPTTLFLTNNEELINDYLEQRPNNDLESAEFL